ncbi:MAG TPA: hypothetical protein VF516_18750, partial [Kofleriaceae bacterium]
MAPSTTQPGLRALNYHTPIGHTSFGPIFLAAGGSGGAGISFIVDDRDDDSDPFDDGGDGDEDDDDGDDEIDDGDEPDPRDRRREASRTSRGQRGDVEDGEAWKPPTQQQWTRVQDALKKANAEAGRRRVIGRHMDKLGIGDDLSGWLLDRGIDPETGRPLGDDGGGDESFYDDGSGGEQGQRSRAELVADYRRSEQRGAARTEALYKPGIALYAAEAALREAGWVGKRMDLALQLIDPGQLDIAFDEETRWPAVTGLTEQIEAIMDEFPDWFADTRRPATASRRRRDEYDEYEERSAPRRRPPARTGGAR